MTSTPEAQIEFDVIVVGAGHAGCEAALAAARLRGETLLLTINADHIAQMSCNPAIGGIAKGQVVREIDALGGEMGLNTDAATIQFRMLNRSRGPAVRSPRAQCDKLVYQRRMKHVIERQPHLRMHQAQAVQILTNGEQVTGVRTEFGDEWRAKAVVIATGTFLAARLHYGLQAFPGGRAGDPASAALAESLRDDLELETGRLKTGTPPRILARTIDFDRVERQDPDPGTVPFSFRESSPDLPRLGGGEPLDQLPCYITNSTKKTADIIRQNLDKSPLYSGRIDAIGTRYCPSFEDKVVRFPHHETHQIYIEPEGGFTDEYYLNGISTSLPPDVQWQMIRSLPGLENAHISRYAYAIEYDFVVPHQLESSLALKRWPNLFLAGQVNGTSGYEEAAGQGLIAGINAARLAGGANGPLILRRDQAYIGVMIDDLVSKDIIEPYRLFTSRAEYRLLLRQDNADLRLMSIGHEVGLISDAEHHLVVKLEKDIADLKEELGQRKHEGTSYWELLRRPKTSYQDLPDAPDAVQRVIRQVEIDARYEGYIQRELARAEDLRELENWHIPTTFEYDKIKGLGNEARLKLNKFKPKDLAHAARIDGITPVDIALLQVHLKR